MPTRLLLSLLFAGCFTDSKGNADASASSEGSSAETTASAGTTMMTTGATTGAQDPEPTSGAGSTGADDTGSPCQGELQTLVPARPTVMLVIDRSGRMATTWDHDGLAETVPVTFWSSVHAELSVVLTKYQDRVNFGATTFPASTAKADYTAAACEVSASAEVPPGQKNGDVILAALPPGASTTLAGGDPITVALRAAIEGLTPADPALPRQIYLITNGLAQCGAGAMGDALFESYDGDAPVVAAEALGLGMPVHVIGVGLADVTTPVAKDGTPDSVSYFGKYEELATAGGTAPFVNASTQAALPTAIAGSLDAALTKIQPCVVALDVPATSPEQTIVTLAGVRLMMVPECGDQSGWRFVGQPPYTAIELCGAACDSFQKFGAVDVLYCGASD